VLTQIVQMLRPIDFEPKRSKLVVRFGTTDYVEHTLLPRLLARIRSCAPDTRMVSRRVTGLFELPRDELDRGLIDFAIGPFSLPSSPAASIRGCLLYHEPFVCIMNARLALRVVRLSLSEFIGLEHIVVCYPGEGPGLVDRVLAERNVTRNTVLTVPHFVSAAFAVAASSCIATVPQTLALALAEPLGLTLLTPPVHLTPMAIGVFWHTRSETELGSTWVRSQIVGVAKQFCPGVQTGALQA
jgi:DNA-binding transcriptional LysR family regulator